MEVVITYVGTVLLTLAVFSKLAYDSWAEGEDILISEVLVFAFYAVLPVLNVGILLLMLWVWIGEYDPVLIKGKEIIGNDRAD